MAQFCALHRDRVEFPCTRWLPGYFKAKIWLIAEWRNVHLGTKRKMTVRWQEKKFFITSGSMHPLQYMHERAEPFLKENSLNLSLMSITFIWQLPLGQISRKNSPPMMYSLFQAFFDHSESCSEVKSIMPSSFIFLIQILNIKLSQGLFLSNHFIFLLWSSAWI